MSNRVKIVCVSCSQSLVVDVASAGKKVRCPKCQSVSVIPQSKVTASSPPTAAATRVVGCPKCKTRMSVPVREASFAAKCPGCQMTVQVAANSTVQPSVQISSPPRLSPTHLAPQPAVTASDVGGPVLDLGALNLPPAANSNLGSSPLQSPTTSPLTARVARPKSKSTTSFLT